MQTSYIYIIKVQGELPDAWSERMQGMTVTVVSSGEDGPITILEGPLRDQAALSGVLNTLYDRHIPVISVERINEPEGEKT